MTDWASVTLQKTRGRSDFAGAFLPRCWGRRQRRGEVEYNSGICLTNPRAYASNALVLSIKPFNLFIPSPPSDCKCDPGYVDVRAHLPANVTFDSTGGTPCVSASAVYCSTGEGSGCVTFIQGALVSIEVGWWKYSSTMDLSLPGSVNTAVPVTDAKLFFSDGLVYPCSGANCLGNTTGLNGTGCSDGNYRAECSACFYSPDVSRRYFAKGGACVPCSNADSFLTQAFTDVAIILGVVMVLAAGAYVVNRALTANREKTRARARKHWHFLALATWHGIMPVAALHGEPDLTTRVLASAVYDEATRREKAKRPVIASNGAAKRKSAKGAAARQEKPAKARATPTAPPLPRGGGKNLTAARPPPAAPPLSQAGGKSLAAARPAPAASSLSQAEGEAVIVGAATVGYSAAILDGEDDLSDERANRLEAVNDRVADAQGTTGDMSDWSGYADGQGISGMQQWIVWGNEATGDKIKIVFSFLQIMALIPAVYQIEFPAAFLSFASSILNVFALNIFSVVPLDCQIENSYYNYLYLATLLPYGVILLIHLTIFVVHLFSRRHAAATSATPTAAATHESERALAERLLRDTREHETAHLNLALKAVIWVLFLVYPSVSSTVLQFFSCMKLGSGFYVMRYSPGTTWYVD